MNIRGNSEEKYSMSFDFLGFTIQPHYTRVKGNVTMILPRCVISRRSVSSVLEKFKSIHKRRVSVDVLARELNPIIRGVINYYCKFWSYHTQELWNQLNKRLQKWVKWEKGLYRFASVRWLKQQYMNRPNLFAHWKLVRP